MQASRIASSSCCRTCTDKTVQWRLNKMYRHHWASIDKKSRPATYLVELALWDAVSVVDDARWFKACGFVELDQQLSHHGGQILNDVLTVLLHPHRGTVSTWVGIHTANNLNIIFKKINNIKSFIIKSSELYCHSGICGDIQMKNVMPHRSTVLLM